MAAMGVFERHSLSNGLRADRADAAGAVGLLLRHARRLARATRRLRRTGSRTAEHMFFKGTERWPTARDIAGEIDSIGGEFNAFTGKEYTGYYVRCAAETRDTALDVLVDMLRHSRFDPEEIEREKGVIIEEMNMYFPDTPRDFIGGVYETLLYGDQPLGWDIIGRKENVRGATQQTFLDYTSLVPARPDGRRRRRPARRRAARPARGAARQPARGRDRRRRPGSRVRTAASRCTRSSRTRPISCSASGSRPLVDPTRHVAVARDGGARRMSSRPLPEVRGGAGSRTRVRHEPYT